MTDRVLPAGLQPGRTTPTFTDQTVPAALRSAHHTTVWAELIVDQGVVLFVEEDPHWQARVSAGSTQAIVPHRKHHVEPEPGASFRVQFYEAAQESSGEPLNPGPAE